MGNAVLEGRPFRIDPAQVAWNYTVNTSERKTLGGKVVQVFGTTISDLTVAGSFGVGGYADQLRFLAYIRDLGTAQLDRWPQPNREPFRFVWAAQGWDFKVWLLDFSEPGGMGAVNTSEENFAPQWTLTFFVVDDSGKLKTVAEDAYISRLSAGIGWKRTEFNGPMGWDAVHTALAKVQAHSFREYLSIGYGLTQPGQTDSSGNTTGGGSTAGTVPADGDVQTYTQQLAASDYGWSGAQWDALHNLVNGESGWRIEAQNPGSTAYGLFQFLDTTWGNNDDITKDQARADWHKMVTAGLNYIKARYGNPVSAWNFWNSHNPHWY